MPQRNSPTLHQIQLIITPCYSVYTHYFPTNAALRLYKGKAAGGACLQGVSVRPTMFKTINKQPGKPQESDCRGQECRAKCGSATPPGEVFFSFFQGPRSCVCPSRATPHHLRSPRPQTQSHVTWSPVLKMTIHSMRNSKQLTNEAKLGILMFPLFITS